LIEKVVAHEGCIDKQTLARAEQKISRQPDQQNLDCQNGRNLAPQPPTRLSGREKRFFLA